MPINKIELFRAVKEVEALGTEPFVIRQKVLNRVDELRPQEIHWAMVVGLISDHEVDIF